jgi:hypothetical protein
MTHFNGKAFSLLFVLPILAVAEIEPKRPLGPEQQLKVTEGVNSVTISGETFSYTVNRENGLIASVRVAGREITDGTPIPDLILAEQLNPDYSPYAARREKRARVTVRSADPSRVVIVAEGQYASEDGKRWFRSANPGTVAILSPTLR